MSEEIALSSTYCFFCSSELMYCESTPVKACETLCKSNLDKVIGLNILFARAHCIVCKAKYIGWYFNDELVDLSFRSTFDAYYEDSDLPEHQFIAATIKIAASNRVTLFSGKRSKTKQNCDTLILTDEELQILKHLLCYAVEQEFFELRAGG